MKKVFPVLITLLFLASLTSHAITWVKPIPAFGVDSLIGSRDFYVVKKEAYLYHVGRGQFLAMGTSEKQVSGDVSKWPAYLDSTDVSATRLNVINLEPEYDNNYCAVRSGYYYWLAWNGTDVFFWCDDYHFRSIDKEVVHILPNYYNLSGGACNLVWDYFWSYPSNTYQLGWSPQAADTDWDGNPTGTNQMVHLVSSSNSLNETDWRWVSISNYQQYVSRHRLYKAAIEADRCGINYAIYTDTFNSGTIAEMDAATEALLTQATAQATLEERISQATLDNPQDVTELIANPDFAAGNADGWTVDMPNARDKGYQYNTSYTHGEAYLAGFIQAWHLSTALGNGSICTTVNLLPAGRYRLEADVIATCQTKAATDDITGCQLYVSGYALDKGVDVAAANNSPRHFSLDFTLQGGALTLGLRAVDTDANWLAGDNFRLTYYGKDEHKTGDLNGDGEVDIADITRIVNIVLGKE